MAVRGCPGGRYGRLGRGVLVALMTRRDGMPDIVRPRRASSDGLVEDARGTDFDRAETRPLRCGQVPRISHPAPSHPPQ